MDEMLEGIDRAYWLRNAMLPIIPDSVLETMLYHAKSYDHSLNCEKVRVRKQKVQ